MITFKPSDVVALFRDHGCFENDPQEAAITVLVACLKVNGDAWRPVTIEELRKFVEVCVKDDGQREWETGWGYHVLKYMEDPAPTTQERQTPYIFDQTTWEILYYVNWESPSWLGEIPRLVSQGWLLQQGENVEASDKLMRFYARYRRNSEAA